MDDLFRIINEKDIGKLLKLSEEKLKVLKVDQSSLSQTEVNQLGKFACSILNKLIDALEKENVQRSQISGILQGVYVCCDAMVKCQAKTKRPLDMEKSVYYVISALYKKDLYEECHEPARYLCERLVTQFSEHPEAAQSLAHNAHVYLWNATLKPSVTSPIRFELVFRMRLHSILFCILGGEKSVGSVMDKVTYTPEKMESSLAKLLESQTAPKDPMDLVSSLCQEYEGYCSKLCLLCLNAQYKDSGRSSTDPNTSDLYKLCVLVESLARFTKLKCLYGDTSVPNKLFQTVHASLSATKLDENIKDFINLIGKDLEKTLSISPLEVLSTVSKVVGFVLKPKTSDTVGQAAIFARIALSHCRHFLHFFRGRENQNCPSVGVAMTAYGHLALKEQVAVEEIYELGVKMLNKTLAALKKSKTLGDSTLRDKKALELELVMFESDLIYALAGRLQRCKTLTEEERAGMVKKCWEHSEQLSGVLKGIKWAENTLMSFSEHKHFGYLQLKVGRVIGDAVSCQACVPHYKLGTQHYKIWNPKASKEEKQKQPLHVRYEMLVRAQRKAGLYEDALRTACDIVLVNKARLAIACENWQQVKQSVINHRGVKDRLVRRTMWQEIMSICVGSGQKCTLTPEEVYREELTALREQSIQPEVQMMFIEEYLQVTRIPLVKARLLLFKAANAWTTRNSSYGEPESLVQEALSLVKSCDHQEKTFHDDLASAHLMQYIVQDVDITQMEKMRLELFERKKKKKEQQGGGYPGNHGNQMDELEQAELFNNCCTVAEETEIMAPAVAALEKWEKLVEMGIKADCFQFLGETSLGLLTLAQIFKLRDWASHESRALQLAITVGRLAKYDSTVLEATWLLCRLFNRNMQPHITTAIVEDTESWVGNLGKLAQKDALKCKPYVDIQGAHAEALLLQNKLEEGYAVLKKALALKQEHFYPRCRGDLLLDGYLCRVQARFLSLPQSFWSEGAPEEADLPLELTHRATRSVGGVVTSVLGDSFINLSEKRVKEQAEPLNVMDKWSLIDQLLECYQEAGSVYTQMGDGRESTVYIDQGILVARTFNLPKRRAVFHLLESRLYNISEKFAESAAHLHSVSYIFSTSAAKSHSMKADRQIEKPTQEGSESPEAFQIQTMDLDFEDHVTMDTDSRPTEKAASPKHKREKTQNLDFLGHKVTCDCVLCTDVDTVRIGLHYVLCCGEMNIMQGHYGKGKEKLNGLMSQAESFTKKASSVLEGVAKNVMSSAIKIKKKQAKQIKHHTFQDIVVEGCKLMTYVSLIDLDLKAHQEWTVKLGSYLQLEPHPWAVTSWVDMAESQHLSVAPSVPYPPLPDSPWKIDELCNQIDALNVKATSDIASRNCATPVTASRRTDRHPAVNKAPVKRRKGLLGLMAEADAQGAVRTTLDCGNGDSEVKAARTLKPKKTKGKLPQQLKASPKSGVGQEFLTSKKMAGVSSSVSETDVTAIPSKPQVLKTASNEKEGNCGKGEAIKSEEEKSKALTDGSDSVKEATEPGKGDSFENSSKILAPKKTSQKEADVGVNKDVDKSSSVLAPKKTSRKKTTKEAKTEGLKNELDVKSDTLVPKTTALNSSKPQNIGFNRGSDDFLDKLQPKKTSSGNNPKEQNLEILSPKKTAKKSSNRKNTDLKMDESPSGILAPRRTARSGAKGKTDMNSKSDGSSKTLAPKRTSRTAAKNEQAAVADSKGPTTGGVKGQSPNEKLTLAPKRTTGRRGNTKANIAGAIDIEGQEKNLLRKVATKPSRAKDSEGKALKAPTSRMGKIGIEGGKFDIYVDENVDTLQNKKGGGKENDPKSGKTRKTALDKLMAELSESEDDIVYPKGKDGKTNKEALARLLAELSDSEDEIMNAPNSKRNIEKNRETSETKSQQKLLASKPTSKRQSRAKNGDSNQTLVPSTLKVNQGQLINGALPQKSPLRALINAHQKSGKDVFDFECSTPEVTPVKPKKQLKKVATSRAKRPNNKAVLEVSRNIEENEEILNLSADSLVDHNGATDLITESHDIEAVSENKLNSRDNEDDGEDHALERPKKNRHKKGTTSRMTRSRTVKEDQRFDSDECSDEIVMDLDVSVVMEKGVHSLLSSPDERSSLSADDRWFKDFYEDGNNCGEVDPRNYSLVDLSDTMVLHAIEPVDSVEEAEDTEPDDVEADGLNCCGAGGCRRNGWEDFNSRSSTGGIAIEEDLLEDVELQRIDSDDDSLQSVIPITEPNVEHVEDTISDEEMGLAEEDLDYTGGKNNRSYLREDFNRDKGNVSSEDHLVENLELQRIDSNDSDRLVISTIEPTITCVEETIAEGLAEGELILSPLYRTNGASCANPSPNKGHSWEKNGASHGERFIQDKQELLRAILSDSDELDEPEVERMVVQNESQECVEEGGVIPVNRVDAASCHAKEDAHELARANSSDSNDFDEPEVDRMDGQNESQEDIFSTPTWSSECTEESGMEVPRKTVLKVKGQGQVQSVATVENSMIKSLQNPALDQKQSLLMSPLQGGRSLRVGSIKQRLLQAFGLLRGKPPSVPYRQICHALATVAISEGNSREVAFYLTESQSVVFRHRALMNVSKRTRKMQRDAKGKPGGDKSQEERESSREKLKQVADTLGFTKGVSDVDKAVDMLPEGWTVCQLSVMKRPSQEVGDLYLINIVKGQPIIVQKLSGYSTSVGQEVLPEFGEIMRGNTISMHLKERQDWWNTRTGLDTSITKMLEKISSVWLGGSQALLHGMPVNQAKVQQLDTTTREMCEGNQSLGRLPADKRRLLMMLIKSCHILKDREILQLLCDITGRLEAIQLEHLLREVKRVSRELGLATVALQPVILILDRTIQQLPWENLHFLKPHPVSRVPSLYFLELLLRQQVGDPSSVFNTGVDPSNAFYVLNPDANLPITQNMFEDMFKNKLGWTGTAGTVPSVDQVRDGLSKHDLYVYCGHGGGNRYVSGDTLATFECRSCVFLMGCSSGKLIVNGKLDAYGLMLNYFLAGCPCIIANLWDVTDRDIDRFTEEMINHWMEAPDNTVITQPMENSRQKCRLKGLIGAAPAVYGIPLRIVHKKKEKTK